MKCFLFDGLNDSQMLNLKNLLCEEITFSKGDELYKTNHIGILSCGKDTVSLRGDNSEILNMRTINSGEIFGSASVFGEWKDGLSSITAEKECKVIYISETDFKKIICEFPTVSFNYITFLTERIRFLNRKIDTFTASSATGKIYEFLLSVADDDGNINTGLSMSEIARRLKMGRSSLYRSIDTLKEKGIIKKDNHSF
ncbi:MAG: Crp/Fnr family transcriptional regulator, partial [Clostridia bacterium]|nr:Crp/Fnr family transcriptional regulator [Clostridia bacterium]